MVKKMKILVIANKVVFPALDGGAVAMKKLAHLLASYNQNLIDIICISKDTKVANIKPPTISTHKNQIKQIVFKKNMGLNILDFTTSILKKESYQANRFYHSKIKDYVQKLINENQYNIVIFESVFTTVYLNKLKLNNIKIIFRAHNIEHKIWQDLAKNTILKKIAFYFLANQIKKMENTIPKYVDHIITISKNDAQYFNKIFQQKTKTIHVNFDIKNNRKSKIRNSIFHLGSMNWKPNHEGIGWFLHKVKKLIENENIKIYLAGKDMPSKYFKFTDKNTFIEGQVENSEEYMRNKEILIVPIFSGSGIRIKILEGMTLGIPVISTTKGAQGIPYTDKKNIIIANKPDDFKKAILKLINNKNFAKKIAQGGQELIQNHFGSQILLKKWQEIIN